MDLKMMREKRFSEHFLDLMDRYHFDTVAPDQDYINAICSGHIKYLDDGWDTMPPLESDELTDNPNLIHYNLFQKPWCYDDIPYEDYFWEYAKSSPFYEEILSFKAGYDESKKQADKSSLERLISKAAVMHKNDVTFKKLHESGVRIRI